jgi:hypothetical protein
MQAAGSKDLLCAVTGSYTDWRRCDICPGEEINVTQCSEHRELEGQRARVLPPDWKHWKHQGRGLGLNPGLVCATQTRKSPYGRGTGGEGRPFHSSMHHAHGKRKKGNKNASKGRSPDLKKAISQVGTTNGLGTADEK